jgi:hypothetical protein
MKPEAESFFRTACPVKNPPPNYRDCSYRVFHIYLYFLPFVARFSGFPLSGCGDTPLPHSGDESGMSPVGDVLCRFPPVIRFDPWLFIVMESNYFKINPHVI